MTESKHLRLDWFQAKIDDIKLAMSKLFRRRMGRIEFLFSLAGFSICMMIFWLSLSYLLDLFPRTISAYVLLPILCLFGVISLLTIMVKSLHRINDSGKGLVTFLILAILLPVAWISMPLLLVSNGAPSLVSELGRTLLESTIYNGLSLLPLLATCLLTPSLPITTEHSNRVEFDFFRAIETKLAVFGTASAAALLLGSVLLSETVWLNRPTFLSTPAFYFAKPQERNLIYCNNVSGVVVDIPETKISGYSGLSRDQFKDATFVFSYNRGEGNDGYIDVTVTSPIQSISLIGDGLGFDIENRPLLEVAPDADLPLAKRDTNELLAIANGQKFYEMPITQSIEKIKTDKPDTFTITGELVGSAKKEFETKRIEKFIFNKINDYGSYQLTYIRHVRGSKDGLFGVVHKRNYDFERTSIYLGTCQLTY